VQGPRQSIYNAYSGAMRIFALSLFFNKPPSIYEDGRQTRDFVNIKDVVDANLLVLEKPDADFQVFNVGGGVAWTINQFYEAMQKRIGKELEPLMEGSYRYGDTRHIFSDTRRLQSLGWLPKRSVQESISDYWDFLVSRKEADDILAYAQKHMRRLNVVRKSIT
jgi:dTDP-L-rhamnose 4-epimerase